MEFELDYKISLTMFKNILMLRFKHVYDQNQNTKSHSSQSKKNRLTIPKCVH